MRIVLKSAIEDLRKLCVHEIILQHFDGTILLNLKLLIFVNLFIDRYLWKIWVLILIAQHCISNFLGKKAGEIAPGQALVINSVTT